MTDLRTLIAHYREIEKAATPGPWAWTYEEAGLQALYGPKEWEHHVLWCRICDACVKHGGDCTAAKKKDQDAIAASRNLFAALLDVAEAAGYLAKAGCEFLCDLDGIGQCTCGRAAMEFTIDRLREAMEANRG